MRIVVAAVSAALIAIALPSAARASDPANGEVSASHLVQEWTGQSYGYPGKVSPQLQTHQFCISPFCDSFSLDVKDAGHLKVDLTAPTSAKYVDVLVTKPDGSTEFLQGNDTDTVQEVVYKDAAKGTYLFDIWPNELPVAYTGQYDGRAELCTDAFSQCFLPPPDDEE